MTVDPRSDLSDFDKALIAAVVAMAGAVAFLFKSHTRLEAEIRSYLMRKSEDQEDEKQRARERRQSHRDEP